MKIQLRTIVQVEPVEIGLEPVVIDLKLEPDEYLAAVVFDTVDGRAPRWIVAKHLNTE